MNIQTLDIIETILRGFATVGIVVILLLIQRDIRVAAKLARTAFERGILQGEKQQKAKEE